MRYVRMSWLRAFFWGCVVMFTLASAESGGTQCCDMCPCSSDVEDRALVSFEDASYARKQPGKTELHKAVERAIEARGSDERKTKIEKVRELLRRGRRINAKTDTRYGRVGIGTPLHYAARAGDEELVDMLLDYGANPNKRHGQRAFRARRIPQVDMGEYMWWTPLHWAAYEGRHTVVEQLCKRGAKKNMKTIPPHSKTPLQLAHEQGHERAAKALSSCS